MQLRARTGAPHDREVSSPPLCGEVTPRSRGGRHRQSFATDAGPTSPRRPCTSAAAAGPPVTTALRVTLSQDLGQAQARVQAPCSGKPVIPCRLSQHRDPVRAVVASRFVLGVGRQGGLAVVPRLLERRRRDAVIEELGDSRADRSRTSRSTSTTRCFGVSSWCPRLEAVEAAPRPPSCPPSRLPLAPFDLRRRDDSSRGAADRRGRAGPDGRRAGGGDDGPRRGRASRAAAPRPGGRAARRPRRARRGASWPQIRAAANGTPKRLHQTTTLRYAARSTAPGIA
jgi:hypothetical protein